ncbi:MAG: hypothetical protein FWD92_05790 [Methanomassiliicoccaceae archaeon]|nr:hypothetical protein [Methanomassiliicoccaceae archaeon]
MIIARGMEYAEVLNAVKGRKAAVWTCDTCARLCDRIGGKDAADRLAYELRSDGIDVVSSTSVSAACLISKICLKMEEIPEEVDIIISLTCDIGVKCAARTFKKEILSPLVTLGRGFVEADGTPVVISAFDEYLTLNEAAKKEKRATGPLV